ncbi:putative Ig domain-containing protein [Curtobacterium sp. VKM Ac-1393]|uniref:putative Ig domain-containing protein n=1 Tax=Curtobacterium sp. VKM Ac-1393 TaxID=2783814 RepID=UPI00188C60A0|nr:putative Ig domain-containing protein [Curtobacterium sp. VKM Ac-1393]MBF4609285.1 putative Ig domain-containing protein [Curtobacterium sp. VKM Ac-1393]
MHRSTSAVRRACAVGTTVALVGLTTGLGIMSATAASAVEPIDSTQPVTSAETPAPADTTETPAPTEVPSDASTDAPAPAEETPAPTDEATTPDDEPAAPETTAPAAETPAPTATPTPDVTAKAADATVTIDGAAKVGSLLSAVVTGFDEDSSYKYVWADQNGAVLSKTATYRIDPTDVRKTITVTVTGMLPDATDTTAVTSEATAPVTQDPAFLGTDGKPTKAGADADHPLALSTAAGDTFSYTFRAQGSPEPTYKLDWFESYDAENAAENEEEGYFPSDQLPDGLTFDASTGELSGVTTWVSEWDFAVTATSGTASVTQYVALNVEAGAPAGIMVYTTDRAGLFDDDDSDDRTTWIIEPDGSVITLSPEEFIEGGRPTIEQGGTLVVAGGLVDRYGNPIVDDDEDAPVLLPTVTSDIASDVIAPDPDFGEYGLVNVTFPHASTHNLTVAAGAFSTSFPVEVQPTAATVVTPTTPVAAAPVTPTNRGGQLAYTGSDATGALPWALGLLVAGAGLIGARTLRRRRAQR